LRNIRNTILLISSLAVWSSCATPTTPTGGPADKTGPKIVRTVPKTGTTNYHQNFIEFDFSEFVNRSSFQRAFQIQPALGLKYKIDWGRKSLKVKFDKGLPDSATIIFTVGTDFTDYHSNPIKNPYTLALSTGPRINKGKINAKVLNSADGQVKSGDRVLLYRDPVDLSKPALYMGETDTGGVVHFSYLQQGKYTAFWLEDRNRNKMWDKKLERAQPFPKQFVTLLKDSTANFGKLYIADFDTVKPHILGIGVLSTHRLRLRFSEPVKMTDSTSAEVLDTSGTHYSNAIPLYRDPKENYVLFFYSLNDLLKTSNYQLKLSGITDLSGNHLKHRKMIFQGSDQKDTTAVKIVRIDPEKGLYPDQPLKVTYSGLITNLPVVDSLKVIQDNKLISKWKKVRVDNNLLYIYPDPLWQGGVNFQFRLYNPASLSYKKPEPQVWSSDKLGSLSVMLPDSSSDTLHTYHLEVLNEDYHIKKDTTLTNNITINNLPPLDYVIKVYEDNNKNGKWDSGSVEPYKAPEPYFIQKKVPVKSRLTSEIHIIF
jgi:hypothetical protein